VRKSRKQEEKMFFSKVCFGKTAILVVLAVVLIGGSIFATPQQEGEEVTMIAVLPQSGPHATWGVRATNGIKLAVEQVNEAGGLLGRQINLEVLDTEGKPAVSVAAMRKAVERKPYVVLGTNMSSSTLVNMEILEKAGIPQFPGSTSPNVTNQGNKNIFPIRVNAENIMLKVKDWIVDVIGSKKLAIMFLSEEYGKAALDALTKLLEGSSVEIVEVLSTDKGQTDFTGELLRVKKAGADTLYIIGRTDENARKMMQIKKLGLDVRVIGMDNMTGPEIVKLAGDAANGVATIVDDTFKLDAFKPMAEAYNAKHGEYPSRNSVESWLSVMLVAAATEAVGEFDQQKLRDYLHDNTLCAKDHKWLPVSLHYDEWGVLDRETYEVMTANGEEVVNQILAPRNPEHFSQCK
jgi:branched-chain amino acid transport system substrate-binding protein